MIEKILNKLFDCRFGSTRTAILVGDYAIKIPSFVEYRLFLYGLLGNMQEKTFWDGLPDSREYMCPIIFAMPGGFFNIMRRAKPVTMEQFLVNADRWYDEAISHSIPVENKMDSWGILDGKLVVVDYGSNHDPS